MGYVDPMGLFLAPIEPGSALGQAGTIGRATARADGPLPFGDALAGGLLAGAAGRELYNHFMFFRDRGNDDCGNGGYYGGDPNDDDDDGDRCNKRFEEERNFCRYRKRIFQPGCLSRASNRRNLCYAGVPDHAQPPRWSIRDER